jgi:hypothetical protein
VSKKFDRLKQHIAREYEAKGIPPEKAEAWGAATAAKIGREKYGKEGMERKAEEGREHGGH